MKRKKIFLALLKLFSYEVLIFYKIFLTYLSWTGLEFSNKISVSCKEISVKH